MSNNGVEGTIVLLDTDVGLLETLASFFRLHGFAAEPFYNTRQILLADAPIGPGCLLMEWELGESNGLQVLGKLRQIGWTFPCVFYTGCSDISSAVQAIREGAANFITKPCPEERLLGVVRAELQRSAEVGAIRNWLGEVQRKAASLTAREREVITLATEGLLNKQIGDRLGIALPTVKLHRGRAMRKLGARNTAELVHLAGSAGLGGQRSPVQARPEAGHANQAAA